MIQQVQTTCDACQGEGKSIPREHRCGTCGGRKTVKETKRYELTVRPGMEHGQQLVLRGQANEHPEMKVRVAPCTQPLPRTHADTPAVPLDAHCGAAWRCCHRAAVQGTRAVQP